MSTRESIVAGKFYPGNAEEIRELLEEIRRREKSNIDQAFSRKKILGCVVPHAGYVYSAYEAVHFFEILRNMPGPVDTFIIVNPNHTGYGEPVETDDNETWSTPLGKVETDERMAAEIGLPRAARAQQQEHAAEVMLPLLQHFLPYSFRIVVVSMLRQHPGIAAELARRIHSAGKRLKRNVMLIASSDFSHFETPEVGRQKDELVIEQIQVFDTGSLYNQVIQHQISVCGYGPIMTLMEYAKLKSSKPKTHILARGHSGKTRPAASVVDYITILFYQE